MRLTDLYWRPMTTEPPFPGKGAKLRTLLLRDKQCRVWEVQANRRTFPLLREKYPDANGWAFESELLLPEYAPQTIRDCVYKGNATLSYLDKYDRNELLEQMRAFAQNWTKMQDAANYWSDILHERNTTIAQMSKQIKTLIAEISQALRELETDENDDF